MKLSNVPNFRVEDFPGQQEWISKLFVQLNPLVQSLNQVLANLDFATNIRAVTRSYTVTDFTAFNFQWTYPDTPPNSLIVVRASKGSNSTPTILLAAWSYNASTFAISVTAMTEVLTTSVAQMSGDYQFTIRASI